MSYIIAFVKFDDSDMTYPVECFRTDIKPQGRVLVRLANERIKQATVERVDYLNWDCTGRIAWKAGEARLDEEGRLVAQPDAPETVGLVMSQATAAWIKMLG
ncbi:TPA: hypothetical protein RG816_004393 [Klebsiella pneumoniae]|nr:hypothetical protein [Klebsiella pneumoniae]